MTAPTLTLKVAFRSCRRGAGAPATARTPAASPMARRIALAHHIETLIATGEVENYADAAARLGLTRARITQISDLALLAPDIQAAVLDGRCAARDRHLYAVGKHSLWTDQRRVFASLFPHVVLGDQHDQRNEDRSPERN
ncbi:MAG: hypothetical protein ABL997_16870 [Planctomycetota bacterium]